MAWLFPLAYWCSGLAGLIYEVCWTRLLTLYIGHTTAAASAVVAAFLGGLAVGAAGGGLVASRLTPRQSLYTYLGLEIGVGVAALVLPFEVTALTPLLKWAYRNGDPGPIFPAVRLFSCLIMVFAPAAALGATFPMAIRWFANDSEHPARSSGLLYALNTAGAAIGALVAGFTLIPAIGLAATTRVGVAASALAALSVVTLALAARGRPTQPIQAAAVNRSPRRADPRRRGRMARVEQAGADVFTSFAKPWLAVAVLGLSGFAALIHEIAWTRILSLVLGPTIYAFAAALTAVIGGVACGSGLGTWIAGRSKHPAGWLAFVLAAAALSVSWTGSLAGGWVPRLVAHQMATSSMAFDQLLRQGTLLAAGLIVPTAVFSGAAFPLALSSLGPSSRPVAGQFADVYAVNTVGAVSGSLISGFVLIPALGLQRTLGAASVCLIAASLMVLAWGRLSSAARAVGMLAAGAAASMLVLSPPWDRALLASGAYLYAPYVPKELDLYTQLKAGTLLYDRDGAAATVSVKRLTGTMTLAVDGKVDASNRSDMLTQKLAAHLPLLLHESPREVAIIGLGSGVTVGAALHHPITRADVIEISPEVVEASQYFADDNQHALDDPRTHLIVGDGRSHMLLSARQYDVIISEPSNPWIAGVAALFTREFFVAARARLAPGGIMCQWAHTYNISDHDLRAIVATFTSVFPTGTLWLIGGDDVLLVASVDGDAGAFDRRLSNIERNWQRPGVAKDLETVAAVEPFSILSLFVGAPENLARYTAGATILIDDRMALEFSGPRALHTSSAAANEAALIALVGKSAAGSEQVGFTTAPPTILASEAAAGAAQWRRRGAMMFKSDAYAAAYDDYTHALMLDPNDGDALDGLVRSAVLTGRAADALAWVRTLTATHPANAPRLVAASKLSAASGLAAEAAATARQATVLFPAEPEPLEQLASLLAEAGDAAEFDQTVDRLRALAPNRAGTLYYAAVSAFLHGRVDETVRLAEHAIAVDARFAPVYDLIGAAYTKLGRPLDAQKAFETSLHFDAHDSTAYTNLGLLELAAGNRPSAANYFAEALGLAPTSTTAREGLAQATSR